MGDIILVKLQCPRGQWPIARILEPIPGRDGIIRAAKVQIRGKTSLVSTKLLYPLEANNETKQQ